MKHPKGKIRLLIHLNRYCDRGCKHCMFATTTEGDSLSPRLASIIPIELAALSGEKSITLTGGGEPLLWPWLCHLLYSVLIDGRNKVHLITSGCRNEYDTGYRMLSILSRNRTPNLVPYISFSPYNPTSEKRLRFTLPFLMKISGRVVVKLTSDYTTHQTTETVAEILQDMGYRRDIIVVDSGLGRGYYRKPGYEEWIVEDANLTDQLFYREKTEEEMGQSYYLYPHVEVYSQALLLAGRGKDLYKGTVWDSPSFTQIPRRCPTIWNDRLDRVTLEPDGYFYPCSSTLQGEEAAHLRIGKLGEMRLSEVLARREAMAERIRRRYITLEEFDLNICETCRNDGTF